MSDGSFGRTGSLFGVKSGSHVTAATGALLSKPIRLCTCATSLGALFLRFVTREDGAGETITEVVKLSMITEATICSTMYEAMKWAATELPPDVVAALRRALEEETEPLARRHLLEWVARSIEQGVDGFEIRIRHHMGCPEWEAFGFGPGPRSEYLKQTGMDLLQGGIDYAALQRIRGEGWLEFARQAGQRLRAAGKRLSHELIWYMGLTPEERCRFGFRIPWERMIREGLVDELSFKGVSPFTRVGRSMLRLAHEHEIPVRMELHQEPLRKCAAYRAGIPQMIDECRKMGFAGLNIYETASYLRAKPDGTFGEGLPGSIEFWRQMSERFRRS